jgi:biotin carboxylase
MKKKWAVVIPSGKEVIATIETLKVMGYSVVGVDENPAAPAFEYCDESIVSPINNTETILYNLKSRNIVPECFIPVVSDKAVLPCYTLNRIFDRAKQNENVLAFYSKSILRDTLHNNKFPVPAYHILDNEKQLAQVEKGQKIIVKPDDSSGSRGITILESNSPKKIKEAFQFAAGFSSNKKVIVEEYIPGEELMIDCFINENKVAALSVSEKKKIADKVSYLIYTLNTKEFPYKKLETFLERLVKVLKYDKGPMHIEVKYHNGKFYILDLAVRGGGFGVFNYYVHQVLGFSFVKATIQAYLNKAITEKAKAKREGLIYFLTPSKAGVIKNVECSYVPTTKEDLRVDYYYKNGQSVTTDVTDGNRLAGIYCFADTKEELDSLFEKVKASCNITYK